jgi:hypothetical protein
VFGLVTASTAAKNVASLALEGWLNLLIFRPAQFRG